MSNKMIRSFHLVAYRLDNYLKYFFRINTNTEITKKLFISYNTLKTHIKNIFYKLDVNDRETAVIKYKNNY